MRETRARIPIEKKASREAQVLTKAFLRASEALDLSGAETARIVGISAASLSRLSSGRSIAPESKEGELALLFLRVFRSLDALVGGDASAMRQWFRAVNDHLGGIPVERAQTVQGLVELAGYLDAMRGRS